MSRSLLTVLAILAFVVPASAQVQLSARRPNSQEPLRPLVMKNLRAEVNIVEDLATTKLDQTFHNPSDMRLEGYYTFTLPEGTAVRELAL